MMRFIPDMLRAPCRLIGELAIVAGSLILSWSVRTSAQELTKSAVPVRLFSTDAPAAGAAATGMNQQLPSPASSGLPPQYQTTRRTQLVAEPPADDGSLRFIVCLVEQPILAEIKVTIDGKPFRILREERIDKLLKGFAEPAGALVPAANAATTTEIATDAAPPGKADSSPTPTVDNSILARLRRYSMSTKRPPSRDEVRWLLTNWADGPTLLLLDENYQRVRAGASPLFPLLDRDGDSVLSPEELRSAEKSLWTYDGNQDEVLSLSEINQGAERTPDRVRDVPAIPPLIPLDQLTSSQTFRRLRQQYKSPLPHFDRDGDEVVSETELAELRAAPPVLLFHVAFDTLDPARSRLEVLTVDRTFAGTKPVVRETSLTYFGGGTLLELSAVQSRNMPESDQISLGAVRDGFPLLPEVDANEDGRLTIRELSAVSKCLASFDRDQDGKIAKWEIPPTLRVSVGLGPIVHRQLATVRNIHPVVATATLSPPEWFVRMDRNQDGDLTRREFLGGKEQFTSLDADKDELISAAEASVKRE